MISTVLAEDIEVCWKYSRTTHHMVADQPNSTISDFIKFSALSGLGTTSICRKFTIGKFASEKLLINISFSDQIDKNGNRFLDTDLNDMVWKILDQFTMNSMKVQAKNDEFMLLGFYLPPQLVRREGK
ncbi:hypothetical protein AVEN_109684-1 [Araneus ventricosus]|uniref:Uncharacterized protein n=1 Tax=Araneus ventricosus TaxID=182803 RepID=A0A4Y2MCU5_ARAVE|nr:hypothetical protein AVEN_109684-1 [Araneus ventricosus]